MGRRDEDTMTPREDPRALVRAYIGIEWDDDGEGTKFISTDRATPEQLREQLLWQLTVLRFIEERFRPGVLVTDEEVRSYYDQHLAEIRKQNPGSSTFEIQKPKIRSLLEGDGINKNFTEWLEEARKRYRIDYRQEALE